MFTIRLEKIYTIFLESFTDFTIAKMINKINKMIIDKNNSSPIEKKNTPVILLKTWERDLYILLEYRLSTIEADFEAI